MKKYDYLIVGAGLFGCVFAYHARRAGKSCLVIDRRSHTGGNVYCEEIASVNVHKYGAHIFHTSDRRVWDFVCSLTEFNHYINSPIANYKGEIYNLPFNMNTFNRMWGVSDPESAREIIHRQRGDISGEPKNLEEQAISLVGRDIYEKLIKGYTEKQWGRDCSTLPSFIIKRLPVRYVYDNNYFSDPYQGIPHGGYNTMVDKLLEGIDLRLDTDYFSDKKWLDSVADRIVYTGLIDEYYGARYGHLEYRSLRFEHEVLDTSNYQGVAVVNYTDKETPFTRIIEHKHFDIGSNTLDRKKTVVTREYPADWHPGDEPYYPVNDDNNQNLYEEYKRLSDAEPRVIFGGRLAEYRYYDMDKVIGSALDAAARELG